MRSMMAVCAVAVVGVSLWGCGSASHPAVRPTLSGVRPQIEGALSPQEESWLGENCPAGTPLLDPSWPYGPTALVAREGYALQHACVDRIPLWVCEHVTADELSGSAERRDRFAADPELDVDCRSELEDYRRSGFDRGHMAPAGNQVQSQDLKDETFFLSNMSPQVGSGFNRSVWAKLEGAARGWVDGEEFEDLYIITGGFFYDPEEEDASTADGVIEYETIGPNAVAVPTHFYKIVAGQNADDSWKAVGFVMENRKYPSSAADDFTPFIQSIDWIEEHTLLDFLPNLGPVEGPALESTPGQLF